MKNRSTKANVLFIAFTGVMAAIVFVVTYFRFPLFGSKVHFANAMCLLSGLLLGPVAGGLAAGIGSAFYDLLAGYGGVGILITFFSKAAMAVICALLFHHAFKKVKRHPRAIIASVIGAFSYVVFYLSKHVIELLIAGSTLKSAFLTSVASKGPATLLNAVAAFIVAPLLYFALVVPLRKTGALYGDHGGEK